MNLDKKCITESLSLIENNIVDRHKNKCAD